VTTAGDGHGQDARPGSSGTERGELQADLNEAGRATAITVFSRLNRWGNVRLPLLFTVSTRFPHLTATVSELSFIHFARWSVIRRFPDFGDPQPKESLKHRYLFFESNFNGTWDQYIDAFSHILTTGMTSIWGTSFGFPRPIPVAPFKAYIRRNEYACAHYWSAYPTVTRTMAVAALELAPAHERLRRRAAGLSPEEFAAAWTRFVTDQQRHL
jgi:hypothetical protein